MANKTGKIFALLLMLALLSAIEGCAGLRGHGDSAPVPPGTVQEGGAEGAPTGGALTEKLGVSKFMLSPGDEISIVVYGHEDLTRKIRIPADGKFFYPIVGEIDTKGMSLKDLRGVITKGLSERKEQFLSPGDKISVAIFGHDEFSREIVVPSDGHIFFPLVGDINTDGRSLREIRQVIVDGLSKYRKSYLAPGDEISITVYHQEELSRKMFIPPDGVIFIPLVGEIRAEGKSLGDLRKEITEGLSGFIEDPQVGVDLVSMGMPKIVVDPQVSLDIMRISAPKRIADPQVGVEVSGLGGHKVFVFGEVQHPGVFLADGQAGVVDAIAMAGGLTLDAKQRSIVLIKGGRATKSADVQVLDLKRLYAKGDISQNPVVGKGDIIYVPRTFISNVDRFFDHLDKILKPLFNLETGYWVGQHIETGVGRGSSTSLGFR